MNLAVFERLEGKLKDVPDLMEQTFQNIMRDEKEYIFDLNQDQLSKGLNADETPIEPGYAEVTKQYKRRKGQESRWVTLKDKGDFYRGFDAYFTRDKMTMFSRDAKEEKLTKKYGPAIFGLSKTNKNELKIRLQPILIRTIKLRF